MPTYYPPSLQITQNFISSLLAGETPLYPVIIGPSYALHRYSVALEKALLAAYDRGDDAQTFAWPNHQAGGIVDLETARVMIENALLQYFEGYNCVEAVAPNGNLLKSGLVFKTNAYANVMEIAFGTREVRAGDRVQLNWIDGVGDPQSFETVVAGFVADVIPGTTAPVPRFATHFGSTTQAATESVTRPHPTKYVMTYDPSAYRGLIAGYPQDTYSIRVMAVGTGITSGGTMDGTQLLITSAGDDPDLTVTLGVANWDGGLGAYTVDLGNRGATMTIGDAGSGSVVVGQTWEVTVSQNYTEVTISNPTQFDVTGPYTGDANTQYIVGILTGGRVGTNDLVVTYRTNNGVDAEGQISVKASDFAVLSTVSYPIGNLGMSLTFGKNVDWCTGDTSVFDVAGQQEGAIHTLALQDIVPVTTGIMISMSMFLVETRALDAFYTDFEADYLTVKADAFITTDSMGAEKPLALYDGTMYADYRERLTANANKLAITDGLETIDDLLGPIEPANPLAYGVYLARQNSQAVEIYYMAVATDDLAGYLDALGILTEYDDIYQPVVLTDLETVKMAVLAHVVARSSAANMQWRIGWVGNPTTDIVPVYTELANSQDIMATVTELSAGQFRRVSASGALFNINSVRAGDTMRINYRPDGTYDEYTVDRIVNESSLVLVAGPDAAISVPIKIEFWRSLTQLQYASALGAYPAKFGNRRMYVVWADGLEFEDGTPCPLYYADCALCGARAGVAPHAPLSRVQLYGLYMDPVYKFSSDELNIIAAGGNWVLVKSFTGEIYTRHQVSSAIGVPSHAGDLLQQEQTFTTNTDDISRTIRDEVQDLYGSGNVSADMLTLIRQRLNAAIQSIVNRSYPATLGPQLVTAAIAKLEVNLTNLDTVDIELDLGLPPPLNRLRITLQVSAAVPVTTGTPTV